MFILEIVFSAESAQTANPKLELPFDSLEEANWAIQELHGEHNASVVLTTSGGKQAVVKTMRVLYATVHKK